MGVHGLGRKSASEKYDSPLDYLNKHIFPIKDILEQCKEAERKALKLFNAAQARTRLTQQKLDWAYGGLEKWRK